MAKIVKEQAGGAPRLDGNGDGYYWDEDGQAVDVDDVTAPHLLRIPGFSEVVDARAVRKAEKIAAEPVPVAEAPFKGPDAAEADAKPVSE